MPSNSAERAMDQAALAEQAKVDQLYDQLKNFLPAERKELMDVPVVNVGEPAMKGAKGLKTESRGYIENAKKYCEDRKINDPENGLFAVADGVSSAEGVFASEVTSRIVSENLGASLSESIKEWKQDGQDDASIDQQIADVMRSTVADAHKTMLAVSREMGKVSATTLSLVRTRQLENGVTRMYYGNVGDSRIYVVHPDGRAEQLSEDDNMLTHAVREGDVTAEEAAVIDQFTDKEKLSREGRAYADRRNLITSSVGQPSFPSEHATRPYDVPIKMLDLQPGMRIVVVSDGIADPLLNSEIGSIVSDAKTSKEAERMLQERGVEVMRDVDHPRKKALGKNEAMVDDASAVVFEVPEATEQKPERSYRPQDVEAWSAMLADVDVSMQLTRQEIQLAESQGDAVLVVEKQLELNKSKQEKANLEYWTAQAALDAAQDRLTEMQSTKARMEPEDQLTMDISGGKGEANPVLFEVMGYSKDGKVVLLGEQNETVYRKVVSPQEAVSAMRGQLRERVAAGERLVQAKLAEYKDAQARGGELQAKLAATKDVQAQQQARNRANLRASLQSNIPPSQRGK